MSAGTVAIPKQHRPIFKILLSLDATKLSSLLEILKNAKPSLIQADLAETIASQLDLATEQGIAIAELFTSLHVASNRDSDNRGSLVRGVIEALKTDTVDGAPNADWGEFEAFMLEALSPDTSFSLGTRALDVMREYEHVYCESRILTDIRPVFTGNEEPSAFVFVHNLKIGHDMSVVKKHHEFFVALDSADLRELRDVCERAIRKEAKLNAALADTSMSLISVPITSDSEES